MMARNETMQGFSPPFFLDASVDWPVAQALWRQAWPLHVYTSAIAYVVLAGWALVHLVRVSATLDIPRAISEYTPNLVIGLLYSMS